MRNILKQVTNQLLLRLELQQIISEKNNHIRKQDYENAAQLRIEELALMEKMLSHTEISQLRKEFNKISDENV